MSTPTKRGLGRGLASLIPGAEQAERATLSRRASLFAALVDAGLDLVDELVAPELTGYLHVVAGEEPTMVLRRPTMSALTPTTAFRLFHLVAYLSNQGPAQGTFEYEGMSGLFVRSHGANSDGLHLFAAHGLDPDDPAVAAACRTAAAFAAVCHDFDSPVSDGAAPQLVVALGEDETVVDATITQDGAVLSGRGTAATGVEAVVAAVVAASGSDLRIDEVRDAPVDEGRAVIVVLSTPAGEPRLGLAISELDVLQTAAQAALRALDRR